MANLSGYKINKSSKETIEPEEIFFDPSNITVDSLGQSEVPIKRRNIVVFFAIVIVFMLFLGGKSLYLQIFKYDYFVKAAETNRTRRIIIEAPRGIIFDRNGKQLVFNESSFDLAVVPAFLPNNTEERTYVIRKLSGILNIIDDELDLAIGKHGDYFLGEILLKSDLNRESALMIEGQIGDMDGIYLISRNSRKYLDGEYFSHILGYVGKISPETLSAQKEYSINDSTGKSGIELYYENYLRGINGEKRFEFRKYKQDDGIMSVKDPEPGKNLLLTIDYGLQKKMYDALSQKLESLNLNKGAGVIINPSNGEILALVSFPSFDNNFFNRSLQRGNPEIILKNPDSPLLNRVISGTYPPGSIIKPLIGSALLEKKIVYPYEKIYAEKSISIVNKYNPDIIYTFNDWKEHGWVNIIDAIAYSSNVYFYTFGGGYQNKAGLGITEIKNYLEKFNLGKTLGIDIFGEKGGLLPDPEWKKRVKNEDWYIGDTYNVAIGQGDVAVTPLQLVSATGYIASLGPWYKPHLVKEITDGEQINETIHAKITDGFIEKHNMEIIKQGMRKAVTDGSARLLSDLSVEVAGKTGTAQFGNQGKTHAWFTGFAPYNDPELAITILIEGGGEGSASAVPVAKEIIEWYYSGRNIGLIK